MIHCHILFRLCQDPRYGSTCLRYNKRHHSTSSFLHMFTRLFARPQLCVCVKREGKSLVGPHVFGVGHTRTHVHAHMHIHVDVHKHTRYTHTYTTRHTRTNTCKQNLLKSTHTHDTVARVYINAYSSTQAWGLTHIIIAMPHAEALGRFYTSASRFINTSAFTHACTCQ
jgi:hypothetical protein